MKKPLILITAYINVDNILSTDEYVKSMEEKIKTEYYNQFYDIKIFAIKVYNQPTKIECIYNDEK